MLHDNREVYARALWDEIKRAATLGDDRELWFVWKKNFASRFWRDLGAAGIGALCRDAGIDYADILRRITVYDMSLDKDSREVEEQRVRDSQRWEAAARIH